MIPHQPIPRQQKPRDIDHLIDQAARLAADDPRHAAVFDALTRLASRRIFGPRFGDAGYKPVMEFELC